MAEIDILQDYIDHTPTLIMYEYEIETNNYSRVYEAEQSYYIRDYLYHQQISTYQYNSLIQIIKDYQAEYIKEIWVLGTRYTYYKLKSPLRFPQLIKELNEKYEL